MPFAVRCPALLLFVTAQHPAGTRPCHLTVAQQHLAVDNSVPVPVGTSNQPRSTTRQILHKLSLSCLYFVRIKDRQICCHACFEQATVGNPEEDGGIEG